MVRILCFICFFSSCTTIKYVTNQKIDLTQQSAGVTIINNLPIIDGEFDGIKTRFLIDTGATTTFLTDSLGLSSVATKAFGTFGKSMEANRKKNPNKMLTAKVSTALFNSDNKTFLLLNKRQGHCKTAFFQGIIGMDMFFHDKMALMMDFGNSRFQNISPQELSRMVDADKYKIVKSQVRFNMIYIYLHLEGKEYRFKLDTGYTGSMIIPLSDEISFQNTNTMILEGSVYNTLTSNTSGKEILFEKMPIAFAGQTFETKVNVSTSIKAQNLGMAFIKGYDWIIDYNQSKVYVKRNKNKIESTFNRKVSYYVTATNKLTIITKEHSQTKYNLGDEIITVNGEKVTPQNICEFQDLLNKTEDWNTLNLEVAPATTGR